MIALFKFCTSAAIISASSGSHVALSQQLLSFLFNHLPIHLIAFCGDAPLVVLELVSHANTDNPVGLK